MGRRTYGGSDGSSKNNNVIPDNAGGQFDPSSGGKGPSNKILIGLIGGGALVALILVMCLIPKSGGEENIAVETTAIEETMPSVETAATTAPLYAQPDWSEYETSGDIFSSADNITGNNTVQSTDDADNIVVDGEYSYNEDDFAPAETEVTPTIYSEDLDATHNTGNVAPSYDSIVKSKQNDPMNTTLDWEAITNGNKDAVAWIYIPGTSVNYPIMQEPVLGQYYYLDHDYYGNKIISGSIFTPMEPGEAVDAHFLVLGHNMKNGSMFHTLMNYTQEDFYEDSPYVYIYYPDKVEKWHIWTMFRAYMDDPIYDTPIEMGSASHEALINSCVSKTMYKTEAKEPALDEKILTLSTCNNFDGEHKGRFLVNAVLESTKSYDSSDNTNTASNAETEASSGTSSEAEN